MAPLAFRVLLLAAGASCLRMDLAGSGNATEVRGKRRRTGQPAVPRTLNGRSYVFVAGVPGSGLKFWTDVLRRCTDSGLCEPREFPFYTSLFIGAEDKVNKSWVKSDKQHSDRIVPMNLVSPDLDRQPDSVFYRAFASQLSGFEDPRLPLYHKLALSNGDSLKVVVLTRGSAEELLAYNMKQFKLSEEEADVRLAADILTLAAQLSALPAESYRCMSLEELRELSSGGVKPLVGLGGARLRAYSLKLHSLARRGMLGCGFHGRGLEAIWDCPHRYVSAHETRAALKRLEDLCDPADLSTTKDGHVESASSAEKIQWLAE